MFANPLAWLGIPLAIIGAIFLSIGTQLQHSGVEKVQEEHSDASRSAGLARLVRKRRWLTGTLLLGVAVGFQLVALFLAPLLVVQPLGAVALVVTAILNARLKHLRLNAATIRSIIYCVGGIGVFVTVAAMFAVETEATDPQVWTVLGLLVALLVVAGVAWVACRKHFPPLLAIGLAGSLYGFLVTLMKVAMNRLLVHHEFDLLVALTLIGVAIALVVGMVYVQLAHASAPPDLAVAGLTVVDPLVAVLLGIFVLHEAASTPWWAMVLFVISGAVAVYGVWRLGRSHPQLRSDAA